MTVKFYLATGVRKRKFYLAPGMRNGKIYLAPNDSYEKFYLAVKGLSIGFRLTTNLLLQTAYNVESVVPESKPTKRKGSTASLSQIDSTPAYNGGHGLRQNMSSQSLARLETYSVRSEASAGSAVEPMSLASSDGSPSKSAKFFMFGNRGGRRTAAAAATKQKHQVRRNGSL